MSKLKELYEARTKIHADAVVLMNGDQTVETRTKVKAMFADIDAKGEDIANIERADKMAVELATAQGALPPAQTDATRSKEEASKEYRSSYLEYMLKGAPGTKAAVRGGCSPKAVQVLEKAKRELPVMPQEQRDQQAGTQSITYSEGPLGGYFVPAGFVQDIDKATKYFAPLMDGSVCRIMETATGAVLPYPTVNDTNEAWHLLSETTQIQDAGNSPNYSTQGTKPTTDAGNVIASNVVFGAYKGSTGLVRVSLELMQDSAFDVETFLKECFGERLGRGYEVYLTQGTGSSQPLGIVPAIAASGATSVTAAGSSANDGNNANTGANSIGYQDLVALIHSVDPTYRRDAKFMFHDQTLAHLKGRLDAFGRPLWVPSVREGEPDRLAGYEYVINQSFATIAASAKTVAFGAFRKFIIRKVRDLNIVRLDERFADYGEVAFVGFSRIDSKLVDAGTHPLNLMVQHS